MVSKVDYYLLLWHKLTVTDVNKYRCDKNDMENMQNRLFYHFAPRQNVSSYCSSGLPGEIPIRRLKVGGFPHLRTKDDG